MTIISCVQNRSSCFHARSVGALAVMAVTAMLITALAPAVAADDEQSVTEAEKASPVHVRMRTSKGDIYLELNREKAPITVENFLQYVDDAFYDGTIFHRVMPAFMIQGGGFTEQMRQKPTRQPITNEARYRLSNERGTVAMARTANPDSATSQFFINVVDNPRLDRGGMGEGSAGYAVFGRVIHGMDVVDTIRHVPTTRRGNHGHVPREPVVIESVRVISKEDAERARRSERHEADDVEDTVEPQDDSNADNSRAESDARAIELADAVMEALGGREAWEQTRHLTWRFGPRRHVWDKFTGNVRMEIADREGNEPVIILMNISSKQGEVYRGGERVSDDEQLAVMLDQGEAAWINDSYWLFMPYKLRDPGVTLRYVGRSEALNDEPAEIIELTFDSVGRTPENRYHVYIDPESKLVVQWDFFRSAEQDEPDFQLPWGNWQRCGRIMLADDRGRGPQLDDLGVADTLPESVYRFADPVDWSLFTCAE